VDYQESEPAETQFPAGEDRRALILSHLARVQNSRAFRNSDRAKQFLSYVVENALQGHSESLKERTIGVEVFHRSPAYLTGDDPIVRVKAGEVRRRLAQYYGEEEPVPEVRIEIPVGSYIPEFHWNVSADPIKPPGKPGVVPGGVRRPKVRAWILAVFGMGLAFLVLALLRTTGKQVGQRSEFNDFWAPLFATAQPVLICLASPVVYLPRPNLYDEANQKHPGEFDTPVKQFNTPLQFDPNTVLKWKDIYSLADNYVNKDDAYVAADLSELFARIHKTSQVRIGHDFSYDDLRNSPAVLVGAFNNSWTLRMTSELPFDFREQNGIEWIEEQGKQGRVWRLRESAQQSKEYAVVARLLNSKTGQFMVILAGIGMVGTQAAGAFVSRESDLTAGLAAAPTGWQGKNLEMVLESDVIEAAASRPRVLAATAW